VVAELRSRWPQRDIQADLHLDAPVDCDAGRIGQLLSNLLSNAITHGAEDGPVRVEALRSAGAFELRVINQGEVIPSEVLAKLFQPFSRGDTRPGKQGLGLGLYIAAEIARAHGGVLEASSSPAQTVFTLRLPMA